MIIENNTIAIHITENNIITYAKLVVLVGSSPTLPLPHHTPPPLN